MGVEPTGGGDPANPWCEGERWPRSPVGPVCSTLGEGEKKKKKQNSGREVNICSPNTNCCLEVNKTNNQPLEQEPSIPCASAAGRASRCWVARARGCTPVPRVSKNEQRGGSSGPGWHRAVSPHQGAAGTSEPPPSFLPPLPLPSASHVAGFPNEKILRQS